jgi:hypothetical protein
VIRKDRVVDGALGDAPGVSGALPELAEALAGPRRLDAKPYHMPEMK